MAYCTLAELRRQIGVSSTSDDTLLEELIEQAQALIDAQCGRVFEAAADSTRTFDAVDRVRGRLLILDDDLAQITSIINGDGETLQTTHYTTEPRNATPYWGIRLLSSSNRYWTYATDSEDAISITGRWAYSVTADTMVKRAALDTAQLLYSMRDNLADATRPLLAGDGNIILPTEYPKSLKVLIATRRRRTTP